MSIASLSCMKFVRLNLNDGQTLLPSMFLFVSFACSVSSKDESVEVIPVCQNENEAQAARPELRFQSRGDKLPELDFELYPDAFAAPHLSLPPSVGEAAAGGAGQQSEMPPSGCYQYDYEDPEGVHS